MRISVLIVTAVLALCKVNGAEVNVYAAASLTDVMKEIASAYERESGDKILFNFGASSLLGDKLSKERRQICFFRRTKRRWTIWSKPA